VPVLQAFWFERTSTFQISFFISLLINSWWPIFKEILMVAAWTIWTHWNGVSFGSDKVEEILQWWIGVDCSYGQDL